MATHKERLNRGLVNIRDPAELEAGELSGGRNFTYFPGDPAIYRSTGRAAFGTATAAAGEVDGLRHITFDTGDSYLVAMVTGATQAKYRIAPVGDTGVFSDLATIATAGSTLEAVHFRNRYFLFNGASQDVSATAVNSNLVVYLSATAVGTTPSARQHGMLPVLATPTTATAAGTFSQPVTGYYEYWTTEIAKLTQDSADFQMESTFAGTPVTVFVSSTAMVPQIQRPDIVNPGITTGWQIYRSTKKDSASEKRFPTGFLIGANISTAANTFNDTLTVSTASAFPGNYNGIADSATYFNGMGASATALGSDNNVDGVMSTTGITNIKQQGVYGFNLGGFTGSVVGIEVTFEALVNTGTTSLGVILARKRQASGVWAPGKYGGVMGMNDKDLHAVRKSVVIGTVRQVITLGGPTDRWFPSNHPVPFADSDFGTDLMVVFTLQDSVATTLNVDYVTVKVYYGGAIDSVIPFPTVVYTFGDITAQIGKNGAPPAADTGDVYEDTLVTNDKSNLGWIRYSYPGDPEAFPALYYVDFETADNDRVRLIKTVNDRLVVALDNSAWRMNYLPSERDASFDRGKSKAPISRSFGCVSPMCATVFTRDGGGEELAMVSHKGIWSTDGFSFNWLSGDVEWRAFISLTVTSFPIALINDAENSKLAFFYRNDAGGNETYFRVDLHYDKDSYRSGGALRVSGPTYMRNYEVAGGTYAALKSAWSVPRSTGDTSLYFGYGGASVTAGAGLVYLNTGTTIPSNDSTMGFLTRRMYLNGEGNEWQMTGLHGYCGLYTGAPAITHTINNTKTDDDIAEYTVETKTKTLGLQKLYRTNPNGMFEGCRINTGVVASAFRCEYLLLEGEGFGLEDSGA